ncbi:MAG: hypothetical protein HOG49_13285 [Candidatus Scalindua sp.]|jgi:hypothetical protein|nr:hypothetical protein [Candidatus Scalindua sp.]
MQKRQINIGDIYSVRGSPGKSIIIIAVAERSAITTNNVSRSLDEIDEDEHVYIGIDTELLIVRTYSLKNCEAPLHKTKISHSRFNKGEMSILLNYSFQKSIDISQTHKKFIFSGLNELDFDNLMSRLLDVDVKLELDVNAKSDRNLVF